ncbi:suppressor of fused domain protein [Dactylosporangium siamense]|uniref:suppressor of fused domain protein n=1 Tax=Dactylosporangium siamense TaxID=685454 RepID=UPI00194196F9|nr:suppressor of fused domain protein [Dactylosporangium siamense]
MDPDSKAQQAAVQATAAHVQAFFVGHDVESIAYDLGSGRRGAVPDLRVMVVGPGPRSGAWAYVTAGCWSAVNVDGHGIEFVMTSQRREPALVDLIAMVAFYHAAHRLDHWHTMPIGEPWLPGATCDHLLVSLPYLHGPNLERCELPAGHARLLWLLPITSAELAFRQQRGTEALEQRFDDVGIDPTDPLRLSVV